MVAAVAAMAAVAVVIVRDVVDSEAERIASNAASHVAARLLAYDVENDAKLAKPGVFATWTAWETYFTRRCARIAITHGSGHLQIVTNLFSGPVGVTTFTTASSADHMAPTATKAQTSCTVTST